MPVWHIPTKSVDDIVFAMKGPGASYLGSSVTVVKLTWGGFLAAETVYRNEYWVLAPVSASASRR